MQFRHISSRTFLAAAGVFVGAVLLALFVEFPSGPQHWSADLITKYLSPRLPIQHPRIAVIQITPKTLEAAPYLSPIDRGILSDIVTAVDRAGPKAIGLDIIFDRATEPAKDERLAGAIKSAKAPVIMGIVSPSVLPDRQREFQAAFLAKTSRTAAHLHLDEVQSNPFTVNDAVVRKIVVLEESAGPPRGLAQAMAALEVPLKNQDNDYISWLRPPKDGSETFLTIPAEALVGPNALDSALVGQILKGKFVFIGGQFDDRDQHLTPMAVLGDRIPGVFIHAHILQQELAGLRIWALDQPLALVFCIVAAAIAGFLLAYYGVGSDHPLVFEFSAALVILVACILLFWAAQTIVPFSFTIVAFLSAYTSGHFLSERSLNITGGVQ